MSVSFLTSGDLSLPPPAKPWTAALPPEEREVTFPLGPHFPEGQPDADERCLVPFFSGELALLLFNLCTEKFILY